MSNRHTTSLPTGPGAPDQPPTSAGLPPERKLDLSVTQVVGGALAAVTAAAVASPLGIGGTLVGAALASVVAAVAGSLYTASLRHTREKVRTAWTGRTSGTGAHAAQDPGLGSSPGVSPGPANRQFEPRTAAGPRSQPASAARLSWRRVLLGALAVSALAVVLLTGLEALSGQAFSGGGRTTIEQISSPGKERTSEPSDDADEEEGPEPSATPSTEESEPGESATPEPTASLPVEEPAPGETEAPAPTEPPVAEETPSTDSSAAAEAEEPSEPLASPGQPD